MKIAKVTTIAILLIGTMVGATEMMEKHDRETKQAYEKYEACFLRTYHMKPSTWYATQGELPKCDN